MEWKAINDQDPNEEFPVEGDTFEDALYAALAALGWRVVPQEQEE
jgi:hypothetical protein